MYEFLLNDLDKTSTITRPSTCSVELQWLESFPIGAKAINGLFVRENVRSAQTMRSLEQTTGSFSKGRGDRYLNGVIHSGRLT